LSPLLRLFTHSFPDNPALDTAVSRALMLRVAAGELPSTLRLARPGRMLAFSKRDVVAPGYRDAVRAARAAGFEPAVRLAGGRAAVFHEGTLELAHARADEEPRDGIHSRFLSTAALIARAASGLGVDARVGEVSGEYCPGRYSVNAGGARKLAGLGQRVVAGGSHTGAVIVVNGAEQVRAALVPVYEALDIDWDPATVGAVADEVAAPLDDTWSALQQALVEEYSRSYDLEPAELDADTLELAGRLAGEHKPAVLEA
jgi:octanoyl-[GcvH]:protein N-octanoyltransferase